MKERVMKSVLVVDDDLGIREAIRGLLEYEGFDVVEAVHGQAAIDYLRSAEVLPDLILLDLMMPVKDGFQFREEQVCDPRLACIPVLVMSADGHVRAKKVMFSELNFIKKPFDIDQIVSAVSKGVKAVS